MATLAKINEPLSKFDGHIIQRAAIFGLMSQNKDVLENAFTASRAAIGSLCRKSALEIQHLGKEVSASTIAEGIC
tara:strand:+ start:1187 stop:1411 length:225 start_codon:yes stop_codon:yes gene_type:complete